MPALIEKARERVHTTLVRRGRRPGLRTAKATLAVVAAFLLAEWMHLSEHPIVAPLVALLVVQLTLYRTLVHGLGRIGGVLAGVAVAVLVGNVVGLTWWSLGSVVAASIVAGRLLRLGPHLFEAPISAMLVLEAGGGQELAFGRIAEAVLGAAVGIVVSVVVAPPLYLQPAGDALGDLAARMARFAREFAGGLKGPWSRDAAEHWLEQARAVQDEVRRADLTVARAEEAARLNPRVRRGRGAQPRLRAALTALERGHITLRTIAREVRDRTELAPVLEASAAYSPAQRVALAGVLVDAAAAVEAVVPLAAGTEDVNTARARLEANLAELSARRDRLAALLETDPVADPAAWTQHGSLLANIDRLGVEVAGAAAGGWLDSH